MPGFVNDFDELRLRIERGADGHQVIASSRVGEAAGSFVLPFNDLELENFVLRVSRPRGRRRIDSGAITDARRFGSSLFAALFQQEIRDLYHQALANARGADRGLRVTLCLSGSPELMDIPWEYLYDAPSFLSVSAFTPVVRYLDLPRGYRPLQVEAPMRILGVVSSPADYDQLDVERERSNLEGALSELIAAGAVVVEWLDRPSLSSLLRKLQSETFHVLHYVGHGGYDAQAEHGVLLFEDAKGNGRPTSGDELGTILHDFTSLRLAVLNACEGARTSRSDPFSGVAESLVQRDIPAVIAMQFEITDAAAVVFAEGFYRAIASGAPVDASLAAARLAIFAESSDEIEWGTPVLFMRVRDGRIFDVPEPAVEPPKPPVQSPEPALTGADSADAAVPTIPPAPPGVPPPMRGGPGAPLPGGSDKPPAGAAAGPSSRWPTPALGAAAVALAAMVALVVVLLGGGSGGGSPKAAVGKTATPAVVSTTSSATRGWEATGNWSGTSGPLKITVTAVNVNKNRVMLQMTASSSIPAGVADQQLTLDGTVAGATDHYVWHIPAGSAVSNTFHFINPPLEKTMTIGFAKVQGDNPAFGHGIQIKGIPLPS
jgi:hypothetical protein